MTEQEDAKILARWRLELVEALEAQLAAQHRARALEKMIEGMQSLYPDMADRPAPNVQADLPFVTAASINIADVVRGILRDNPNRWFTSGEMVREVAARDIDAGHSAVRLALRRTGERGFSEKRGDGKGQKFRFLKKESADVLGGLEA